MSGPVSFYFDYLSPYAYLASCEIEELCERAAAGVRFRPVLFPALLDHWGQRGPAEIAPKAVTTFRSCLRYARLRDRPLRSPRFHPFRSLTALRASLAAPEAERARAVHALFRLGWAEGGDLGSDAEIARALSEAGLDGSALVEAANGPDAKRSLHDETEAAIARGVFGIPTVEVRDELFWGLDQLPFVELVLQGRDPLAGLELEELGPLGVGAWRPGAGAPPR